MQSAREAGRRDAERRRERLPTPETVQVTAEEAEENALAHEALEAAIGYSTTNPSSRVDILTHDLFYPQKLPFKTVLSDYLETPKYKNGQRFQSGDEYYNGQSAIVAVNDLVISNLHISLCVVVYEGDLDLEILV
ncbi:hypothetical protein L1987_23400 [Smallanthus sonchifolius]|uniref:Uncharacterized protein n=1 Tax=Smallanthus sonchifolius TaxID=185202 RepID=A0ACB9II50_9ASTR|nr:hypothetical protein L1987_23400 [Smallanthus sonchifolius]